MPKTSTPPGIRVHEYNSFQPCPAWVPRCCAFSLFSFPISFSSEQDKSFLPDPSNHAGRVPGHCYTHAFRNQLCMRVSSAREPPAWLRMAFREQCEPRDRSPPSDSHCGFSAVVSWLCLLSWTPAVNEKLVSYKPREPELERQRLAVHASDLNAPCRIHIYVRKLDTYVF